MAFKFSAEYSHSQQVQEHMKGHKSLSFMIIHFIIRNDLSSAICCWIKGVQLVEIQRLLLIADMFYPILVANYAMFGVGGRLIKVMNRVLLNHKRIKCILFKRVNFSCLAKS